MEKKTILVTGAAGFIGSHLAEAFLRRGDRVVGLDNLDASYSPARKQANLAEVSRAAQAPRQWEFIPGDIRDAPLVTRLFEENAFDAVVHLAAMTGGADSIEAPSLHYDVNVMGTLNLLNAAQQRLVGNFVFASSASVYSNTSAVPFVETAPCDRPLAPYAASKRAAEMVGYSYHHLYSLNFTALRCFTVYGPRSRPDNLAVQLARGISREEKVRLYHKGEMQRDWLYISDLVKGFVAAADRPLGYEIVNLGAGSPVRVADFIGRIQEYAAAPVHFIPAPLPDIDLPCAFANIEKARRLLGFSPEISLEEGSGLFWKWYCREFEAGKPLAAAK